MANPHSYTIFWLAALAAILGCGSALADSVLEGPRRRELPADAADQLRTLDYNIIDRGDVAATKNLPPDPTLKQQMDALDLEKSKRDLAVLKAPPVKAKLEKLFWAPNWMGTTGGLDLPWAYTLPKGDWAASIVYKNRDAGNRYWPLVYNRIDGNDLGATVSYGVMNGVEVTADVDRLDRTFTYASQRAGEFGSGAFLTPATFQGDRAIVGAGAKASYATEDVQVALGFHTSAHDSKDRNVIEFHDYDRMNNLYAVASTRRGRKLGGHFQIKYVTYDWAGSTFPSGATTNVANGSDIFVDPSSAPRRGFGPGEQNNGYPVFAPASPQASNSDPLVQDPPAGLAVRQIGKGTQDWLNFGFGVDFEPSKNLRLMGELNWESGIEWAADLNGNELDNWFVNVGARYERANWAATLGMRHVNTRDYREPVMTVAYRF